MSNQITITGNPTAAPQLSQTRNGKSVTNLTIVDNRRVQVDGEWQDGEPLFQEVTVWGDLAKNVVNHVTTKQLVTVTGHLEARIFEVDGETRRKTVLVADRVALDLQFGLKS